MASGRNPRAVAVRLRHIEAFHAVMQAGTVSGAAQLLRISQPAATKLLQQAEVQLGVALFERARGKFVPTPEALRLFVEVDKLHGDLVAIRRLAVNLQRGEAQGLRLAATPAVGLTVLPLAMQRWHKALADKGLTAARCQLSTHHTQELVGALLLGEADLALALHDPRHPGIQATALATAPMAALVPLQSPAARQSGPLHLRELPAELIGLSDDDPLGQRLMGACAAHGLAPQMRLTVQTYPLARALAEAGLGTAVVDPYTAAAADRKQVRVRQLEPPLPVTLYLLSAHKAPLSQPARRLVKYLREAAEAWLQPASHEAGVARVVS
jgi:DNA-binding transcriptional LysR family regulator